MCIVTFTFNFTIDVEFFILFWSFLPPQFLSFSKFSNPLFLFIFIFHLSTIHNRFHFFSITLCFLTMSSLRMSNYSVNVPTKISNLRQQSVCASFMVSDCLATGVDSFTKPVSEQLWGCLCLDGLGQESQFPSPWRGRDTLRWAVWFHAQNVLWQ